MSAMKKLGAFQKSRKTLGLMIALACGFSLFAQSKDDVGEIYKQIDMAVAAKSAERISSILQANRSSENYKLIESYTLKQTRKLIITDNLELARQTSLAVIDNNLENFDAVELYSYIDKAILNQQAANQAAENRRRLEAERIAALNAKSKQQIESRGNFQSINTASGNEVYVNEQQASFSSTIWTIKLCLADFAYQKITDPDYSSVKYGLGFGANIFRPSEKFIIGADLFADAHIVTFSASEKKPSTSSTNTEGDLPQEFFVSGRLVPEFAFADLSKNLFIRAGLAAHMLSSNDRDITHSTETFISPVVGLALDNVALGDSQFRLFADYDIGHMFYDEIKMAMEFGTSLLLPFSVSDKTKMGLELGLQDLLIMKDEGGIENKAKFTFAIGVGNVVK